jgi:O-antigen biosynthesis protein
VTRNHHVINPEYQGRIYDYVALAARFSQQRESRFVNFKTVVPSWDNEARKPGAGHSFVGSSPDAYSSWLRAAVRSTMRHQPQERLLFINAWNEWGEGAHLEPDRYYGYAYLQATRNVLTSPQLQGTSRPSTVVLVTHDAYPHGAQFLALNLARTFRQDLGLDVYVVCLGDGPLKREFAKWATVHDLSGLDARGNEAHVLARRLREEGHRCALVNTTVAAHFLATLAENGLECVALIHELRGVLDEKGLHGHARAIAECAVKIVFPAEEVAIAFDTVAPLDSNRVVVRPQGLYKRRRGHADPVQARKQLRSMLNLPPGCPVILGVGYADHRKGVDLFLEAGLRLANRAPDARWVWVGHWDGLMQRQIEKRLARIGGESSRFIFAGQQEDTDAFYGGADVFALTSREDPFPSVVLEALDAQLPVVAFEGAGGFVGLLNEGCGRLVPAGDCGAFADAVADLLQSPEQRSRLGSRGSELMAERFSFRHYAFDLLEISGQPRPRVSVVVPNFNYARYLGERLSSIAAQRFPIFEIIFLDDCSTDLSLAQAKTFFESCRIDYRLICNPENSGSVFRQWKKGVDLATGTHVWIAEADDVSNPDFLAEVMRGFDTPGVVLSYCESRQIDESGAVLAGNYLDYVADIDAEKWTRPFVNAGEQEVAEALGIKNTIPNVSGVVFDRRHLKCVLDQHIDHISSYRIAGDWLAYLLLLRTGKLAFSPRALNDHRRHRQGMTIGGFGANLIEEIRQVQAAAASAFSVPPAQMEAARRYIEKLSVDFNVTTACK